MMNDDGLTYNRDDKLEDALALLAAGVPLEEILADAGHERVWLEPLLTVAAEVDDLRQALPIPPPQASLERLLVHGEQLATAISPAGSVRFPWYQGFLDLIQGNRRFVLRGGLLAVLVSIGLLGTCLTGGLLGGGLVLAAEGSLPGQPLYRFKQIGEAIRLNLAQEPLEREYLVENFNERRRQEIQRLLWRGEQAEVQFVSQVGSLQGNEMIIDSLVVQIGPTTKIEGQALAGARVQVEGVTRPPDRVLALKITVIEPAPPSPTPTLTPTMIPTVPTATATPVKESTSDTIQLAPTPTTTPTPTIVAPTPTVTPPATVEPSHTPAPSVTPTGAIIEPPPTGEPPDDEGDNGNENEVENENEDVNENEAEESENESGDDNSGSSDSGSGSDDERDDSSGSDGGNDNNDSGSSGGGDD